MVIVTSLYLPDPQFAISRDECSNSKHSTTVTKLLYTFARMSKGDERRALFRAESQNKLLRISLLTQAYWRR